MSIDWSSLLSVVTAWTTVAFVVVAVLWLKKLRQSVQRTLIETVGQQVRAAKHLSEAIEQLQKNQQITEQQIHTLAMAHRQLRQNVQILVERSETTEPEAHAPGSENKTFH